MTASLLLGAGRRTEKLINTPLKDWNPVTLDIMPGADVLHDLNDLPLPFDDGMFDEIHAYEVLEHIGRQGDWRFFFAEWSEYYRILKQGGLFCASVPALDSPWLWGDPGHVRAFPLELLTFLDQSEYAKQCGKTAMADYRSVYRGDFRLIAHERSGESLFFILEAVKPSRIEA